MGAKIKIDPEFSALIPAVAADEDGELEREVLADGRILNPLIVWKHQNILLDGHRRHRITVKHPTLKAPPPIVLDLESRQEAHDWIIRHQLSKRNINEAQRRYLIGKLYRDAKRPVGTNQHGGTETVSVPPPAAEIAAEHNVTERTVHNNAAFAEAVDAVGEVAPEIKAAVLSGEVKATAKDLEALAELPKKKARAAAKQIKSGKAKTVKAAVKEIESEEEVAVDGWGVPIQDHAAKAFEAAPLFDELLSLLRKADKLYSDLADMDGGEYLRRAGVSVNARDRWKHTGIKDAINAVQDSKPTYTVCPYEHHAEAFPESKHKHGKDCVLCHGLNWSRPLGKSEISDQVIAKVKEAYGV